MAVTILSRAHCVGSVLVLVLACVAIVPASARLVCRQGGGVCTLREGEPATAVTHGALDPRPYISFFLDVEFFDGVETPDVTVTVSDLVLHTAMAAELEMFASPGKGYEDYESSVATCTADVPRSTEGEVLTLTIGECKQASKLLLLSPRLVLLGKHCHARATHALCCRSDDAATTPLFLRRCM